MLDKPAGCDGCQLRNIGIGFTPPEGPPNARARFIGEAPGEEEAETGRPFVGRAGKELRVAIKQAGLAEAEVYIANTAQCRPPNNDYSQVTAAAVEHCQRVHVAPAPKGSVVYLVGGKALQMLWPSATSVESWRGSVMRRAGVTFIPTLHPAAILRGQFEKRPLLAGDIAAGRRARFELPLIAPVGEVSPGDVLAIDIENRQDGSVDMVGLSVDGSVVAQIMGERLWELQPFVDAAREIVAHNAAHDYRYLTEAGVSIDAAKLRDTMIAQAMLFSDLEVGLGDALSVTLSGRWLYHKQLYGHYWKAEQIARCRAVWVEQFPQLADYDESSWYKLYNALDVAGTFQLWAEQKRLLA